MVSEAEPEQGWAVRQKKPLELRGRLLPSTPLLYKD